MRAELENPGILLGRRILSTGCGDLCTCLIIEF